MHVRVFNRTTYQYSSHFGVKELVEEVEISPVCGMSVSCFSHYLCFYFNVFTLLQNVPVPRLFIASLSAKL